MPVLTDLELRQLIEACQRSNATAGFADVLTVLNQYPDGCSLSNAYRQAKPPSSYRAMWMWLKRSVKPGGPIQIVEGTAGRGELWILVRTGELIGGAAAAASLAASNGTLGAATSSEGGTGPVTAAAGLLNLGDPTAGVGSPLGSAAATGVTSGGAGAALTLNEMKKAEYTVHKTANGTATVLIPTQAFVEKHRIDRMNGDDLTEAAHALSKSNFADGLGQKTVSEIAGCRTIVNWDALSTSANVAKIEKDAGLRVAKRNLDEFVQFGHVCAEEIMREEGNGGWFDEAPTTSGRGEFHAHSFLFNGAGTPDQPPHWDVQQVIQFIVILTMFATPTLVSTATDADLLSYDEAVRWLETDQPGWQPGENWDTIEEGTRLRMLRMAVDNVMRSRAAKEADLKPVISAESCVFGTCVKVEPFVFHAGAAAAKGGPGRWVLFFTYAPPGVKERYTGLIQWNPWNAAVFLGVLNAYLRIVQEYASEKPWRYNNPYKKGSRAAKRWEAAVEAWATWPRQAAAADAAAAEYNAAMEVYTTQMAAKRRRGAKDPEKPRLAVSPPPDLETTRAAAVAELVGGGAGKISCLV